MPKLIFLNRFFYPDESATSQLLTDACLHFASTGHEVHVIASRQRHEDATAALTARELWRGITIHRVAGTRFGRMNLLGRALDYMTFYWSAGVRLWRIGRPGDIAIAKTDPPLISAVAAWVCRRKGMKLVNWVQDLFPEVAQRVGVHVANGISGRLMMAVRDYSLRTATVNVALGDLMAARLRARAPSSRIEVLHNWSDGQLVRPIEASRNQLRVEWDLRDRFVVGYSGNMGRAHEFDTILDACEALRDRSDIVFLFIGGGAQRARLEAHALTRRLKIVFQPFQPRQKLADTLAAADVHLVSLQPALEGLIVPSKFYGVAAAGRTTIFIGDPHGEIPSLLRRGACGVSIATGDHVALATAIAEMADQPEETKKMGERARQLLEREFDMPLALKRWEDLLHSV